MPHHYLITGGAGFIGSNFLHYWQRNYPADRLVVLDLLTYAGNRETLRPLERSPNFRFVQGNICDRPLIDLLLQEEAITTLIHFAAESHVDRSIIRPNAFIQTNIIGTFTLLEAFRHHWQTNGSPIDYRFLHISTDEVYGSLNPDQPAFTETTAYAPNSPYSASKASSDHLVRAYHQTYQLPTLIINCSNNYGPYQFPEKLIPLMILNVLMGKPLPVYGDGQNIRDWLYVDDHCRALDQVLRYGRLGESYNVGGNNEVRNIELVEQLCDLMDHLVPDLPVRPCRQLITFVRDRPGHDRRYAINTDKISQELGWRPSVDWQTGLRKTALWYIANRAWWEPLLTRTPLMT